MKTVGRVVLAAAFAWVAAGCAGTKEATKDVQDIVPGEPMSYREAVERAVADEQGDSP